MLLSLLTPEAKAQIMEEAKQELMKSQLAVEADVKEEKEKPPRWKIWAQEQANKTYAKLVKSPEFKSRIEAIQEHFPGWMPENIKY
jgi:hypothetical protein